MQNSHREVQVHNISSLQNYCQAMVKYNNFLDNFQSIHSHYRDETVIIPVRSRNFKIERHLKFPMRHLKHHTAKRKRSQTDSATTFLTMPIQT